MSPGSVFVLGAGGFIGRHLAERLAAQGATTVVAATRRPQAYDDPHIVNVVAAWDDAAQFLPWLQRCDAVIHAASSSTPGSSEARPQLDGNLRTTLSMIEALQRIEHRRVVFLSSAGTLYGDRASAASELEPLRPRSYHGAGKAAAEMFLTAWASQYGGTAVMLRPTNIYGPGQPVRDGFGIIPTAFDCARHDRPLSIWDGSTCRDYLYVDDLSSLCLAVLAHPFDAGSHVFNAASGEGIALDALIDRIDAVTGRPLVRDYRTARRVDVRNVSVDAGKARATFGWMPTTSLDEGLRRTWQWFSTRA